MQPNVINKDQLAALEYFFSKGISPQQYAQYVRRFVFEALRMFLNETDMDCVDKEAFSTGHWYLNELCEMLDPQLTKKDI